MIELALLPAVWFFSSVQAQTTDAVCASNYAFLSNRAGQSPCLIAAYLETPCLVDDTNWNIPALQANQTYVGPTADQVNYCTCSSVVYSMVSACAACQNSTWISWSFWRGNCGQQQVSVGRYPLDIPSGIAVPAWAYQDVSLTDRWNITKALPAVSAGPESTYYGTPTASINYRQSSAGDVGTAIPTVSAQAIAPTEKKSSNTGAIVGGVVGGIALLALIGTLIWLLIRRKQRQNQVISPTAYYPPGDPRMGQVGQNYPAAVDYGAAYPQSPTAFSGSSGTPPPPLKLYDPSDPSTFPKTPASFGYQSTMITDTSNTHDNSTTTGKFTGVAEI